MLAFWALVPIGVVGIIASLFMKPSKQDLAGRQAAGEAG